MEQKTLMMIPVESFSPRLQETRTVSNHRLNAEFEKSQNAWQAEHKLGNGVSFPSSNFDSTIEGYVNVRLIKVVKTSVSSILLLLHLSFLFFPLLPLLLIPRVFVVYPPILHISDVHLPHALSNRNLPDRIVGALRPTKRITSCLVDRLQQAHHTLLILNGKRFEADKSEFLD